MLASLDQGRTTRHLAFMSKAGLDEDVVQIGRAVAALRERLGVSQEAAADAYPGSISKQYWSMHETGKVPGIVKPATQRKLLEALSVAAALDQTLTLEDLMRAADADRPEEAPTRPNRLARALGAGVGGGAERQAVFPTSEGDVVFQFPADMTPAGFRELEAYFAVFLKAHTRDA